MTVNQYAQVRPYQSLIIMGTVFLGIFLVIIVYGTGLKTEAIPYKAINIIRDGAVIDQIPLKPETARGDSSVAENIKTLDAVKDLFFNYHTKFLMWMFFFCILIGLSFGFILPTWHYIASIKHQLALKPQMLFVGLFWAVLFMGLAVIFAGGRWLAIFSDGGRFFLSITSGMEHFNVMLDRPGLRMLILIIMGSLGPLLALGGIFMINAALNQLDKIKDPIHLGKSFQKLSESLDFFLFVVAINISWTTITTAMGREAVLQAVPTGSDLILPIEFVYLYGLIFTLFLGIIYLPVYHQLRRKGKLILETMERGSVPQDPDDRDVAKTKGREEQQTMADELTDIFLMKSSYFDSFKVGISILGPMLTSLSSKLIEF